jgi:conjugation system TraG family ATPase
MQAQLSERLPILEVSADCIVSKMGDVTIALELTKPEIFTLGEADYEMLHQALVKAMKVLPEGTVFHMQDTYRRDAYRSVGDTKGADRKETGMNGVERKEVGTKGEGTENAAAKGAGGDGSVPVGGGFLAKASDRFFEGRPFLRHRCRVFLTRKPPGRRGVSSATSGLLRKTLVPADTVSPAMLRDFEDSVGQFSRILADSGLVKLRRIPTGELVSSVRSAGVIEQYCYLLDEGEVPMIRDIGLDDGLKVGDQEVVLFTLADPEELPGNCSPWVTYDGYSTERTRFPIGFTAGLGLLLPYDHIYNQYIVMVDQAAMRKKLESKRLRLQSLANYSRENALSKDATNAMLNEAISKQLTFINAHFSVMVWTDRREELKEIKNTVGSSMAGIGAVAHQETMGGPQLWWAAIPGNAGDLPENECFGTFLEQGCCFLAMETNYRSSGSSFGLRFGDRLTGRPVHVDIDDEPRKASLTQNGNLFVLSGSGGGKSYLVNHLCRSYYDQGMHIVLIDIGHSYQVLCKLLGGFYFTWEEGRPFRFNPFYIGQGEVFDTEKKESIKSLLLALWKRSDETQYRSEYVALSNALQAYYDWLRKCPDVFPCFDSFYEFLEREYVKVLQAEGVKVKEFDVDNFLYVIRPYYRGGEFDYLLNATENLNLLSERFIVFELDAVKDHPILFPVVTLVIMDVFLSKMRKLRGVRKMIVIEEAWKAIANAGMAENIRYWVKTLRKFMGKLALVSQEVDDMISSPIIRRAIINNSDTKILLDQSKFANKFGEIQELLGITEKQKAEILSINKAHGPGRVYKDCWICLGPSHSRVYRLETSIEEYLAYTSDQGEKVRVEAYAKEHGSFQKGIEVLARELRSKQEGW